MPNDWIDHVKKYAKKHNLKYNEAIKKAKKTYGKGCGSSHVAPEEPEPEPAPQPAPQPAQEYQYRIPYALARNTVVPIVDPVGQYNPADYEEDDPDNLTAANWFNLYNPEYIPNAIPLHLITNYQLVPPHPNPNQNQNQNNNSNRRRS